MGLLCNRELVLTNPFRELSSPDLLLQQEQSHTKAFSREAKIAPPSPCPGLCFGSQTRSALPSGLGGAACVLSPQSRQSPHCSQPRDQGGSGRPAEERAAVALLFGGCGDGAGRGWGQQGPATPPTAASPPPAAGLPELVLVLRACCQKCCVHLYLIHEEEEHVLLPRYR